MGCPERPDAPHPDSRQALTKHTLGTQSRSHCTVETPRSRREDTGLVEWRLLRKRACGQDGTLRARPWRPRPPPGLPDTVCNNHCPRSLGDPSSTWTTPAAALSPMFCVCNQLTGRSPPNLWTVSSSRAGRDLGPHR